MNLEMFDWILLMELIQKVVKIPKKIKINSESEKGNQKDIS
jgi:hypothetical protein